MFLWIVFLVLLGSLIWPKSDMWFIALSSLRCEFIHTAGKSLFSSFFPGYCLIRRKQTLKAACLVIFEVITLNAEFWYSKMNLCIVLQYAGTFSFIATKGYSRHSASPALLAKGSIYTTAVSCSKTNSNRGNTSSPVSTQIVFYKWSLGKKKKN